MSDGPELKTLLSSEYQIGGAIPSVDGEIYVAWNQLVRDSLQDYGLDRVAIPHLLTTADVGHRHLYTPPPPIYPGKKLNIKGLRARLHRLKFNSKFKTACGNSLAPVPQSPKEGGCGPPVVLFSG